MNIDLRNVSYWNIAFYLRFFIKMKLLSLSLRFYHPDVLCLLLKVLYYLGKTVSNKSFVLAIKRTMWVPFYSMIMLGKWEFEVLGASSGIGAETARIFALLGVRYVQSQHKSWRNYTQRKAWRQGRAYRARCKLNGICAKICRRVQVVGHSLEPSLVSYILGCFFLFIYLRRVRSKSLISQEQNLVG